MTRGWLLVAVVLTQPVQNPIRSHHPRILKAIEDGTRKSDTFKGLVERVTCSNLIVYIESGRCGGQVMSCVAVTSGQALRRYLHVKIDTDHSLQLLIAQIAHELQHALEIAGAPEVVDEATLRTLYSRIGTSSAGRDVYETTHAVAVTAQVVLELGRPSGTHDPH